MRPINLVVIHCSASPNGDSLFRGSPGAPGFLNPAQTIDGWHAQRGFHRAAAFLAKQNPELAAIGYHFVITTTGVVFTGRHLDEVGAHVQGHNRDSLGICLVGTDAYTGAQWDSLNHLVTSLQKRFPAARVCGHRDLSPDRDGDGTVERHEWLKTCPGFDVAAWLADNKTPIAAQQLAGGASA